MKTKQLLLLLILLAPLAAARQKVVVLDLIIYKNDSAAISKLAVRYGSPEKVVEFEGTHQLRVTDTSGAVVWKKDMVITFEAHPEFIGPGPEPVFKFNETFDYSRIAYAPDFNEVFLYKEGRPIFQAPLGRLLCNKDNKCNGYENYLSCSDCGDGTEDGFCDKVKDEVCDGDCKAEDDPDCVPKENGEKPQAESLCGNTVCESDEQFSSCPQDCPSGGRDGYCDRQQDARCDPDCPKGQDKDCLTKKEEKGGGKLKVMVLGLILLLLIGLIVIFIKKRGSGQGKAYENY